MREEDGQEIRIRSGELIWSVEEWGTRNRGNGNTGMRKERRRRRGQTGSKRGIKAVEVLVEREEKRRRVV